MIVPATSAPSVLAATNKSPLACESGMSVLTFKVIKFSNHAGGRGKIVGEADCSKASADYCQKTGKHRISGIDRAGRQWSIEIENDLVKQMQINDAVWGGRLLRAR
jgi:hypothetical protein